jgi:hypothetical protein
MKSYIRPQNYTTALCTTSAEFTTDMQVNDYEFGVTSPHRAEIDDLKETLAAIQAEQLRPDPIVCCQNCAQPTLYDRPCRQCGGSPN